MGNTSWNPTDAPKMGINLETFILEGMFGIPGASGNFTSLLNQITLATKLITARVRRAGLADALGYTGETNVQGEHVAKLDVIANDMLVGALRRRGHCAGVATEELEDAILFPDSTGSYLVVADPLDGSSNIDVDISIGTIFGILRIDRAKGPPTAASFLRKGNEMVAAGYVIYGSSTVLVFTTGRGVHGFTWDPSAGEFFLSHENIRCPDRGTYYSINEGYSGRWTEGVKKWAAYVKETNVADGRPYSHRYVGSLVADAHRTLLKGGIFAYPADLKTPNGKLRLLYEANPFALIFEAAGGVATTGRERVLDITPTALHQRVPLILGSTSDVETFRRFIAEDPQYMANKA
ncbi:MAG TPA: class 1 fructose-bisphosphatase [Polyangiaceae bacterium]|nr:class 1 fructose-bisphosphatase [Polyangiaceae bacterium]